MPWAGESPKLAQPYWWKTLSELILLAASGLAREVLAVVRTSGQYDVVGMLDDDRELLGVSIDGASVLGPIDEADRFPEAFVVVCLESGRHREAVVHRLSSLGILVDRYATVLHSDIRVPDESRIGAGSILLQNVTIGPWVVLGNHVVVMPMVNLAYNVQADDFATFSAGVSTGEGCRIGRVAHIGMNASIAEGMSVGPYASVGMGAAVLDHVPPGATWVGVPAREIRSIHLGDD